MKTKNLIFNLAFIIFFTPIFYVLTIGHYEIILDYRFLLFTLTCVILSGGYSIGINIITDIKLPFLIGLKRVVIILLITECAGFLIYMLKTGSIIRHPDSFAMISMSYYLIYTLLLVSLTYLIINLIMKKFTQGRANKSLE